MYIVNEGPEPGPSLLSDGAAPVDSRGLDQLLAVSAPLAMSAAETLCRHDPVLDRNCSWYHGLWQYLRILGLVSAPLRHQAFFLEALGSLARGGAHPRVLISGTADYAMLALVLEVYRHHQADLDVVVVVDRCETPLMLNRWFAERCSLRLETHACDILDFESQQSFDVICSHSFLVFFPSTVRPRLMEKWRQLLRPGGKLVTISRVRDGTAEGPVGFTAEQARTFRRKVWRAAEDLGDLGDLTPDNLARRATVYARRYLSYPVTSWAGLRCLLEDGGLTIDRLYRNGTATMAGGHGTTAPSISGDDTEYAHILCSRA
jgi:SAM-dependent methyltransferase